MVVGECCSRRKSTAFSLKMLVQLDSAIFTSFESQVMYFHQLLRLV